MRPLALLLGGLAAWLVLCRLLVPRVGARPVYLSSAVLGAAVVAVSLVASHTAYSVRLALPFYAVLTDVMGIAPLDRVEDRLYIGNLPAAWDAATLQRLNVTHVLVVSQYGEQARFHPGFFQYHVVAVQDYASVPLLPHLHPAADFIHAALQGGGAVLVHCNVGRSRSATALAAYFVKYRGMKPNEAIAHIRRKRAICPNPGFRQQLDAFHATLPDPPGPPPAGHCVQPPRP
eukprot:EG_transcript_22908